MSTLLPRLFALCLLVTVAGRAEEVPSPVPFSSYDAFRAELIRVTSVADPAERRESVDVLWRRLQALEQFPFRDGRRVAFLYRDPDGSAEEVAIRGDMNQWRLTAGSFLARLGDSSVWMWETSFPEDARLDYKFFLNGRKWMLDPENPRQQVGGYGPNSELAMPRWTPPPEIAERGAPEGELGPRRTLESAILTAAHPGKRPYQVAYRVYTPAEHEAEASEPLPLVLFTDGQDYAHPDMGRVTTILDNGIAEGRLPPLVAVFVDPRDPVTWDNRRYQEYFEDPESYARFLAEELVPELERDLPTPRAPRSRVIVGTSLGGLFTLWTLSHHGDVIGGGLVQSPAFFRGDDPTLARLYKLQPVPEGARAPKAFFNLGRILDGLEPGRQSAHLLREKGWKVEVVEHNEGHSWGHWRRFVDDGLAWLLASD